LIGALAGFAAEAVGFYSTQALAVATAFGLTIVLTGGIHLDGFLDGCDAFFASVPAQGRLEILKDPRRGSFAIIGFAVVAPAWLAALWSIDSAAYPLALASASACARWGAIVHALRVQNRISGATTPALEGRPPLVLIGLGLVLVAALAWALGVRGMIASFAAVCAATLCILWVRRRLGGVLTGDAYGFAIVVAEVSALIALAA
jgi:adenosylcobinamide-GDP ribazoletransferase